MEFRATLELNGKTATGLEVPAPVLDALAGGKRPAVTVTINGHTYRTSVGVMGGRSLLPVPSDARAAAGVSAGDELDVTVELDTAPRVVEVPEDVAAALAAAPAAKAAYEKLSYSNQRRWMEPIVAAKAPETRARRVAKLLEELGGS